MSRPTLRQRNQAIRNLRGGPAFLTPARVAGIVQWLSAMNVAPAPAPAAAPAAVSVTPIPVTPKRAPVKRPRKVKALAVEPVTISRSRATFRFARPKPVPIAPIVAAPIAAERMTPAARPTVRIIGVQNGASAIHWLRTHGVSVRAASTTIFGTRYLVSNELGEMDIAAVVAVARRKGFEG